MNEHRDISMGRKLWKEWRLVLLFAVMFIGFRSAVADWYVVPTGSMQPTILIGDRVFVSRLAYDVKIPFSSIVVDRNADPQRGDLAVFASPYSDEQLIKRVIGLPGDVIEVRDDRVIINGEVSQYTADGEFAAAIRTQDFSLDADRYIERLPEIEHPILQVPNVNVPRSFAPVTVPADHYFMMGDNRNNSKDSRSYGPVPRELLIGRATGVVWSLDSADSWNPRDWDFRGERLFEPLN